MENIRPPKEDVVFQTLFQKGNERLAKSLIEAITNEKVNDIKINVDQKTIKRYVTQKVGRLDFISIINKNILCNIEVQLNKKEYCIERFLNYWANIYSSQLGQGDEYKKLNKTISIIILGYNLENTRQMKEICTKWKIIEEKYRKSILTDDFEFYIIELGKAKEI